MATAVKRKRISADLSSALCTDQFEVQDEFNPLRLEIEGRILYVNPGMLANHSPMFRKMLQDKKQIDFTGKNPDEILTLLRVLYLKEVVNGLILFLLEISKIFARPSRLAET